MRRTLAPDSHPAAVLFLPVLSHYWNVANAWCMQKETEAGEVGGKLMTLDEFKKELSEIDKSVRPFPATAQAKDWTQDLITKLALSYSKNRLLTLCSFQGPCKSMQTLKFLKTGIFGASIPYTFPSHKSSSLSDTRLKVVDAWNSDR